MQTIAFQAWLIRSTIAFLCPNMINFDAVDKSECCYEEVMFLLMIECSLPLKLKTLFSIVEAPLKQFFER